MYKWIITDRLLLKIDEGASIQWPPAETYGFEAKAWMDAGNTPEPADPAPAPIDTNDFQNAPKWFKAKCLSDLAFRLGVADPRNLTAAQIQTERTRIKSIADAL